MFIASCVLVGDREFAFYCGSAVFIASRVLAGDRELAILLWFGSVYCVSRACSGQRIRNSTVVLSCFFLPIFTVEIPSWFFMLVVVVGVLILIL